MSSGPKAKSTFGAPWALSESAPVGFRSINLTFDLDTDADEDRLATLLRLTERYCVVLQTLAGTPELSASLT